MMPPGPRFDATINYGHLLTVLTLLLTLGSGIIYTAQEQAVLSLRVTTLEKNMQVELARIQSDANARVAQYAPTLNALNKSQDLQDERIGNVVVAVKEMRGMFQQVSVVLNEVKQDVAVMRIQMQVPAPNITPERLPREYQPNRNNPNSAPRSQ